MFDYGDEHPTEPYSPPSATVFVDQTVPCDSLPAPSSGDLQSLNVDSDDAREPAAMSASSTSAYLVDFDNPGFSWFQPDFDPRPPQGAQAVSRNRSGSLPTYVFPDCPPTDLSLPAWRITVIGEGTTNKVRVDPSKEHPLAAWPNHRFAPGTLVAPHPDNPATCLRHLSGGGSSLRDDPRAGVSETWCPPPMQEVDVRAIEQYDAATLACVQQDLAAPPGLGPHPSPFYSDSLNMPCHPTALLPSDQLAIADSQGDQASYRPLPPSGLGRDHTLSPWTSGDTPTLFRSPSSGTSPDFSYAASVTPIPAPLNPYPPPFRPPSDHPDAPVFKIITIGARTYSISYEYNGDCQLVWYYCSHDYPRCHKRYRNRPGNLREHQRKAHDPTFTQSQCAQCACSYTRERDLQKHIKIHHQGNALQHTVSPFV